MHAPKERIVRLFYSTWACTGIGQNQLRGLLRDGVRHCWCKESVGSDHVRERRNEVRTRHGVARERVRENADIDNTEVVGAVDPAPRCLVSSSRSALDKVRNALELRGNDSSVGKGTHGRSTQPVRSSVHRRFIPRGPLWECEIYSMSLVCPE